MKKVTSIVLNNFKNDSRVLKENISLQRAGYDVQVVALHEELLNEFEKVQNIPVHRVKLKTRGWSKQKLIQLIKYFEFIFRVVKQYKTSDILHCNDLNALPIGVIIKNFFNKNAKIVYDAHEYEINDVPNQSKVSIKIKYFLEKYLIKYADAVITVSDSIADDYARMYNIQRPSVVLNAPHYRENIEKNDLFRNTFSIEKEQTIFLYQGALMRGRGIEILIDSFKLIEKEGSYEELPVLVIMGYGVLEDYIHKNIKDSQNIFFHKAVSPDILLNYTNSADIGFCTIEHTCQSENYGLPNKLFEYIMVEKPVIVSNLFEMGNLVRNNSIGLVVKENTVKGIISTVAEILMLNLDEIKLSIKNVKQNYTWELQEKIFLEVYNKIKEV